MAYFKRPKATGGSGCHTDRTSMDRFYHHRKVHWTAPDSSPPSLWYPFFFLREPARTFPLCLSLFTWTSNPLPITPIQVASFSLICYKILSAFNLTQWPQENIFLWVPHSESVSLLLFSFLPRLLSHLYRNRLLTHRKTRRNIWIEIICAKQDN